MDAASLGWLVPDGLKPVVRRQLVRYRRRGLGAADVLLVSYPKSGSTWLRMVIGTALSGSELDFDSIRAQLPPLGAHRGAPRLLRGGGRMLRTHERLSWLDPLPGRVVYLVRDGRDVAASYYHHVHRVGRFRGAPSEFVDRFLAGRIDGYGTWAAHVEEAAARTGGDSGLVVVRYEDLRAETLGTVTRVLAQIGEAVQEGAVVAAIAANTKDRMRDKERRSQVLARERNDGSSVVRPDDAPRWHEVFSDEDARRLEAALEPGLSRYGYR